MSDTATRSQYKIWRFRRGRSMTRWMSDEQVARYKARNPHWRWQKIRTGDFMKARQPSQSVYSGTNPDGTRYGYNWGRYTSELRDVKRHNPDKSKISWDDILDVQLELKKGI